MRETVVQLELRIRHEDDVTAEEAAQQALDDVLTSKHTNCIFALAPLILCNEPAGEPG